MTTRREFLKFCSALGLTSLLPAVCSFSSLASAQATDYKALVCLFLFGGNDGNNVVVPLDPVGYGDYAAVRGSQSNGGLSLPQNTLLPLSQNEGTAASYGLHPSLTGIHDLWLAGNVALLFNTGTLAQPLTRAQYLAGNIPVPENLFSHIDQQTQWQAAGPSSEIRTGWGGRMADRLSGSAGNSLEIISTAGNNLFGTGNPSASIAVPATGTLSLAGFDTSSAATARLSALKQLIAQGQADGNALIKALAGTQSDSLAVMGSLQPVLSSTTSAVTPFFSGLTDSLAEQFHTVAKLIEARNSLQAPPRQVFFVSLGGFDTHTDQITTQQTLLSSVDAAATAFFKAMAALGVADKVTTFTLSDFARTLKPNSGRGSDHGWGNHHLIIGGAVKGGFYGTFPTLALGGPDDAGTIGRWIPTVAVEQYGAVLAKWFGIAASDMPYVLPALSSFPASSLSFMLP